MGKSLSWDNGGNVKVDDSFDPSKGPWVSLKGRALDLKSAYKQLARHPDDAWSLLAVWNPSCSRVEYYESVALPFGSVSAVMCFNRMARALRIITSELFLLVNTNFFDDFCQVEVDELCNSAWATAELLMKILGWKISVSEDKRLPFAASFQMLGAIVGFSETAKGHIYVRNKPSRLDDISALVESIIDKKKVPTSVVETHVRAGSCMLRATPLANALNLQFSLCRKRPNLDPWYWWTTLSRACSSLRFIP